MMNSDTTSVPIRPAVVDVRQAAHFIGLSRATIYRLLAAGDFAPRVRLSAGRYGFKIADLERWLDERSQAGA